MLNADAGCALLAHPAYILLVLMSGRLAAFTACAYAPVFVASTFVGLGMVCVSPSRVEVM